MVRAGKAVAGRSARVKQALYSSAVLSIVTGTVAVLGAPWKW
jgi:hypothetical protein